ncbi:MAG: glycine--tRNA ligase [Bacteroidetes bacterium]|nr:glycine--tRNA ligase [Bacteroidota bacterium]
MIKEKEITLKEIVSHSKEYGFIFPSSEIYDGLQAVYDYGPYGIALKRNLQKLWWDSMIKINQNIVGLDSAILMNPKIWKASGHIDSFHDFMVDNKDSKKRYRVDTLIEAFAEKIIGEGNKDKGHKIIDSMNKLLEQNDLDGLKDLLNKENITCEISKTSNWTNVRAFNLMFETKLGSTEETSESIYLRPETAQGIFVNFLNVQKSAKMQIPFGIAQIGKAFRNEIVARQFIFRMREFEQMEMQFFITPGTEKDWFEHWKDTRIKWHKAIGIQEDRLAIHQHEQLAHYADNAVDIEYKFPFGFRELEGIHSRTDFDLKSHEELSKKKQKFFDTKLNKSYIPYVIETSIGCDRLFLTILSESLTKQNIDDKERTLLKITPELSPIKAAILPLIKKDGLPEMAQKIYDDFKFDFETVLDTNQSIGKRYTKQDLIGTPFCITIDHQSLEDDTITIRYRDSMEQKRIKIDETKGIINENILMKNILMKL